ncbi:hypothetical protein QIJ89_gp1, partial [ssRNA phage Zoerhiza.3_4]
RLVVVMIVLAFIGKCFIMTFELYSSLLTYQRSLPHEQVLDQSDH